MYTFIVNPNSRSGRGISIWHRIEPVLKKKQTGYRVFFTQYRKHATRIVRELTADQKEHTIVVLGGDGTINETVNGIRDFSKVILGYIPTGSSNDFARGFGIPTDPEEALACVLQPKTIRASDVGLLSYGARSRFFAVSTGLGLDAAICHEAVVSRVKFLLNRLGLGKLTYVTIALNRILLEKPGLMTVSVDHQPPVSFKKTYFAAVMNNRYEGGGFMMCPDARPDDGLLDLIVLTDLAKWKILLLLATAFSGKHTRFKGVNIFQGKHISIEAERALPPHTDGEPLALQRKVEISPAGQKLRVITG